MAKNTENLKFYGVWSTMKARCSNPNATSYANYGGRGVTYCPRWNDFKNFRADMLGSYKEGLTLDRKDTNGSYSPENCRWATWDEQENNRRNKREFSFKGQNLTLTKWARAVGVNRSTLAQRFYVYKWPIEKCLATT